MKMKSTLDYFSIDIEMVHSRVIHRLLKREGDAALTVLLFALTEVYSTGGYYAEVDADFFVDIADCLTELEADRVRHMIMTMLDLGIFSKEMFERYSILTSESIQRKYLYVNRRRNTKFNLDYSLVGMVELDENGYCVKASLAKLCSSKASAPASAPFSAPGSTAPALVPTPSSLVPVADVSAGIGVNVSADAASAPGSTVYAQSVAAENVAEWADSVTKQTENTTFSAPSANNKTTQNRTTQNRTEQNITTNLPNPPCEGGSGRKTGRTFSKEDIDAITAPRDGVKRNLPGLIMELRMLNISPSEQYAIILKSNFGAIGGKVWQGVALLRDSRSGIRMPGRYLLSLL